MTSAADTLPSGWSDTDPPAPRDPAADAPAPNPLVGLARMMRDRWLWSLLAGTALAPLCAAAGFVSAVPLYGAQAILRVYPQEANILYASGDDSVLKTFESFVKAETTYVASFPVMDRARQDLSRSHPDLTAGMTVQDLTASIEIKRNDSLIVLTTLSRDAGFAAAKLDAVVNAYLARKIEAEANRAEVRLSELQGREVALTARLARTRAAKLAVGGEFGIDALTRAHVEKIAQIDALQGRKADIAANLAQLRADSGQSGPDQSQLEILRATLLDAALADLSRDRAQRAADLARLTARYPATHRAVQDIRAELALIDRAMAARRDQIRIVGQTGALTTTSADATKATAAELRALSDTLSKQLTALRAEARDLNVKRTTLASLTEKEDETRTLLDETRKALEVIRLEAGRALPGYTVLMSPPSVPADPTQDPRRLLTVAGAVAGLALGLAGGLVAALANRRLRFSDDPRMAHLPLLHVIARNASLSPAAADRIRNALQLHPLRRPRLVGKGRLIAVTRPDHGGAEALVLALAESFARARLSTLLLDADAPGGMLTARLTPGPHPGPLPGPHPGPHPGWRQALLGDRPAPLPLPDHPGLSFLPLGPATGPQDGSAALPAIRAALSWLADQADVVLIHTGSLAQTLSADLILSACDLALAEVRVGDDRRTVAARLDRIDTLPRHGGAVVFTGARRSDPGCAA